MTRRELGHLLLGAVIGALVASAITTTGATARAPRPVHQATDLEFVPVIPASGLASGSAGTVRVLAPITREPDRDGLAGAPAPSFEDTGQAGVPLVQGLATWYCGGGSPCTRGYGPGAMIGAAGSELTAFRGQSVRVSHGGRSVVIRLVDACLCRGPRIVDLSRAAFARLADPGRGVIRVTVSVAGLPATDP